MTTESISPEAEAMGGLVAADTRLTPARGLRRRAKGKILIGGSPLRILHLSAAGARTVDAWFSGAAVGEATAARALAHRLIDRGLASQQFAPAGPSALPLAEQVTVVIPVKDDPVGLRSTLASIDEQCRVVVVDDGSTEPIQPQPGCDRLLRLNCNIGPAGARNRGLEEVATPLVAFIDAGVRFDPAVLGALTNRIAEAVGIVGVAPRIKSALPAHRPAPHQLIAQALADYDCGHSPLDLGDAEGVVGPRRRVPYVPTAFVVFQTESVRAVGGFDRSLRFGEDVDLLWRLPPNSAVLYDPSLEAEHSPRQTLAGFAKQRFGYGSAAGPLGVRHGSLVAPLQLSPWSLAVIVLLFAGHPWLSLSATVTTAAGLRRKLVQLPDAAVEAALLTAQGHGWALRATAENTVRSWWPLTAALALLPRSPLSPSTRLTLRLLAVVGMSRRSLAGSINPRQLPLSLLDDVSYGAGVWAGSARAGSWRGLLPSLEHWPPRSPTSATHLGAMNRSSS